MISCVAVGAVQYISPVAAQQTPTSPPPPSLPLLISLSTSTSCSDTVSMSVEFGRAMEGERSNVGVVGLERGRVWDPNHVLDSSCKSYATGFKDSSLGGRRGTGAFLPTQPPMHEEEAPSFNRRYHRRRFGFSPERCAAGGPGMHAMFIHTKPKSCGTGFFLPRSSRDHELNPDNKPNCSPVLLPSRVMHALNLNKHFIQPPSTPTRDKHERVKPIPTTTFADLRRVNVDEGNNNITSLQSSSSSLEVLLPEEWSY